MHDNLRIGIQLQGKKIKVSAFFQQFGGNSLSLALIVSLQ